MPCRRAPASASLTPQGLQDGWEARRGANPGERLDRGDELVGSNGFQKAEGAALDRPLDEAVVGVPGHHDDPGIRPLALDLDEGVDPVHSGHLDVEQAEIEIAAEERVDRVAPVVHERDLVPDELEYFP